MTDWAKAIVSWRSRYRCRTLPAVPDGRLASLRIAGRPIPEDLAAFYRISNGLRSDAIRVLPVEIETDPKHTWDGIVRANTPSSSRFLGAWRPTMPSVKDRFLVFADIGGGHCAAIDHTDGTIWYEDDSGLHQTSIGCVEQIIERVLLEYAGGEYTLPDPRRS